VSALLILPDFALVAAGFVLARAMRLGGDTGLALGL
jgi:hypothetical protein